MKMSDLEAFIDIVDAGGFTAAALRRRVTQPALSRLLRDMETRLQAQLLIRTGRGIELTPAGSELLKFSKETLDHYQDVRKRIWDRSKIMPQNLRLSVPLRVGRLLIPFLYKDFAERVPGTTVQIFEEHSERAREMLADDQLDIVITYRYSSGSDPNFVPMFCENLYAIGSAPMLGKHAGPITMKNLGLLPILVPSSGTYRELIQAAFRTADVTLRIARELETAEGLLAFAAEGEGIAILPMSNVYQEYSRREIDAIEIGHPNISRVIGVELGPNLPKHASRPILSCIRKSMQSSGKSAAWYSAKQSLALGNS